MHRRTDTTKLIVAFRNFANAPKTEHVFTTLSTIMDVFDVKNCVCVFVKTVARL